MEEEQKVGVLAIVQNGERFLVVRRSEGRSFEAGKWGFIGGSVGFCESPVEALERELVEESGLRVSEPKLMGVYNGIFVSADKKTKRHVILLAYICNSDVTEVKLNEEHSEYRWEKLKDIRRLKLVEGNERIVDDIIKGR